MGSRRRAREAALQILFQFDFQDGDLKQALQLFWQNHPAPNEVREFAEALVEGALRNISEIDSEIAKHSINWRIERMPAVDRNVLRLATYELLFERDIASTVTINEAVDIAKRYGTEESGSFVNGVLDPIAHDLEKKS